MHILPGTLFLLYPLNRRYSLTAHSHLHCIPRLGGGADVLDVLFQVLCYTRHSKPPREFCRFLHAA